MSDRLFEDPDSLFGFNNAGQKDDRAAIVEAIEAIQVLHSLVHGVAI